MKTKQTAVDFLLHEISKIIKVVAPDSFNATLLRLVYDEAKEIEKQQIKDAHLIGLITSMEMEATKQAEEYYNETYLKNN